MMMKNSICSLCLILIFYGCSYKSKGKEEKRIKNDTIIKIIKKNRTAETDRKDTLKYNSNKKHEIERRVFDINDDGKKDTIVFFRRSVYDDPGDFDDISVEMPDYGLINLSTYKVSTWIKISSDSILKAKSLLKSELVSIIKISPVLNGLFIKSYPDGSLPNKYTVFGFGKNMNGKIIFEQNLRKLKFFNDNNLTTITGINGSRITEVYVFQDSVFIYDKKKSFEMNIRKKSYRQYQFVYARHLTEKELEKYAKEDLEIMINEIYADYGLIFKDDKWTIYFEKKDWYKPRSILSKMDIENFVLNPVEKANIQIIKKQLDKKEDIPE